MAEARTFFLLLKVAMTAGDSGMVAERVLYPIQVKLGGQATMIQTAAEFEENYDRIMDEPFRTALLGADEADLILTFDGVKAADGALWLSQFCADAACSDGQFLITQINNQ
jgi:hypothetical protein